MKKALIIIGAIGLSIFAFFGTGSLFIKHIYNKQDCQSFNIDNIELRTGINIPSITFVDCVAEENSKTSKFIINTDKVNLEDYIAKNDFELKGETYLNSGENERTKWEAKLNPNDAELVVKIEYIN